MPTYSVVLVAGAWLGVRCWDGVAAHLTQRGVHVSAVPISGRDDDEFATLDAQVERVVATVQASAGRVLLVGHSHGGTIVTEALARLAERCPTTVFLDAAVPAAGQSTADTWPAEVRQGLAERVRGDGNLPYDADLATLVQDLTGQVTTDGLLRAEPWAALTTPVRVGVDDLGLSGRRAWFVRSSSASSPYEAERQRAARRGWHSASISGGHYPMLTNPAELGEALTSIASHVGADVDGGDAA